jgi:exopolysaccharide biosynthesis polyprenyl glycosylphosphotransferase
VRQRGGDVRGRVENEPGFDTGAPRPQAPSRPHQTRLAYRSIYRRIALTDCLSIILALAIAYRIPVGQRSATDLVPLLLGTPLVVVSVFAAFHLYEAFRFTPAEEFRRIILAVALGITGVMVISFWSLAEFSRAWVGLSLGLGVVLTLASRRIWHAWIGRQRGKGQLSFRTLIVGTNEEASHLADALQRRAFGFLPIGMISTHAPDDRGLYLPVVGGIGDLREVIRSTDAECVFVASSAVTMEELKPVAKAVRLEGVEVRITATLPQVLSSRLSVQPVGGITALSLRPARLTGAQVVLKFIFDIVVSVLSLVILSPLLLGVAIAIKATSPGPVLFRQRRVGLRGRPFTMLKFRTMQDGADAQVDELRAERGVADVMFKLRDDPRVTSVGRWLRTFSIDELPQLFNVLMGDMSLVGPRPPLPDEVTKYEDWHFDRLEAPPGITGLWQISGRSELSFDDCVRLDLFYIENWSLAYDAYILMKTIPVLLRHRGAY